MNWIAESLVVFFSSVLLYLLLRKCQLQNISNTVINLAWFGVPSVILFFIIIFFHLTFAISGYELFLTFIAAILFSYLGNLFSLLSVKRSPNPGYSLIISKSYVVLTSIFAVYLFHSPLTFKNIVAITAIVLFSTLIVINKNENKSTGKKNEDWLLLSFATFLCWGFLALISKYILNIGVNVFVYLFYLMVLVTIAYIIQAFLRKEITRHSFYNIGLLIAIGIVETIFSASLQVGYVLAPNPGYINAVNAGSISLLTLASAYFYKDELTIRKLIGVFGVTVGLLLLFL